MPRFFFRLGICLSTLVSAGRNAVLHSRLTLVRHSSESSFRSRTGKWDHLQHSKLMGKGVLNMHDPCSIICSHLCPLYPLDIPCSHDLAPVSKSASVSSEKPVPVVMFIEDRKFPFAARILHNHFSLALFEDQVSEVVVLYSAL